MALVLHNFSSDKNGTTYKAEFNDYRVGTVVIPNIAKTPITYNASTWISYDMATNIARDISVRYKKNVTLSHKNKKMDIVYSNISKNSFDTSEQNIKMSHGKINTDWIRYYEGTKYFGKTAEFDFKGVICLKVQFKKIISVEDAVQKTCEFVQKYPIVRVITKDAKNGFDIDYKMSVDDIKRHIVNHIENTK